MRGEYLAISESEAKDLELPPRARRIQTRVTRLTSVVGTTSACAENTQGRLGCFPPVRNYLRVRGEYLPLLIILTNNEELPPRARRILPLTITHYYRKGTTSACAENTMGTVAVTGKPGNYLRVRGEYENLFGGVGVPTELPPRARRILNISRDSTYSGGTTSACAENTGSCRVICRGAGNYLRVRGEYAPALAKKFLSLELPPRARRIPREVFIGLRSLGTTSACAENTPERLLHFTCNRNYLRVRGEY